jgi:hypothetical protein
MDNKNHSLLGLQHYCLKLVIDYSNIYDEKIFLGLKNKKIYFTSRKDINYRKYSSFKSAQLYLRK